MKTACGFIGLFAGVFVGAFTANTAPIIGYICILGSVPLGRWIGGLIEEKRNRKESQRRIEKSREFSEKLKKSVEENNKKQRINKATRLCEQYPEATKAFFKIHWGVDMATIPKFDMVDEIAVVLLSHSLKEYQSKEWLLNADYRAKMMAKQLAEQQTTEKKREKEGNDTERKRSDEGYVILKKEEKGNLINSLLACVESWHSHSNSTLKHMYFCDYHSYDKYKNDSTPEMRNVWRTVWHFKNDPDKNVTSYEHSKALQTVINLVENALRSAFGSKTEYLTLVCLTASTQRKTELRYKDFAEKVCNDLNMTNAYPHIRVVEGGNAKHDGGDGSRQVSYDSYFFDGKYVVLFDDVRTTGRSLEQERIILQGFGAKVICAVTIAQTTN